MTKIVCWNVAGVRAMLKKGNLEELLTQNEYDIVLLQETKAEEAQVKLPEKIMNMYPYRFWQSTKGTTQRKGFSGTAIWSKTKPVSRIDGPESDEEGRIITLEFEEFIVVSVYTPNSQGLDKPRFIFRTTVWHDNFENYITMLKNMKPTIIAGDLNVAHKDIDIHNILQQKENILIGINLIQKLEKIIVVGGLTTFLPHQKLKLKIVIFCMKFVDQIIVLFI